MANDPYSIRMPIYEGSQPTAQATDLTQGQYNRQAAKNLQAAINASQKLQDDGLAAIIKNARNLGEALVKRYDYTLGMKQEALLRDFETSESAMLTQRLNQKDGTENALFNADMTPRNAAIDSMLRQHHQRARSIMQGMLGADNAEVESAAVKSTQAFAKNMFGHLASNITKRGQAAFDNSFYSAIDRGAYSEAYTENEQARASGINDQVRYDNYKKQIFKSAAGSQASSGGVSRMLTSTMPSVDEKEEPQQQTQPTRAYTPPQIIRPLPTHQHPSAKTAKKSASQTQDPETAWDDGNYPELELSEE